MPPLPAADACTPRMTSVVALPRILGPTTENTTDAMARMMALTRPTRYGPM